MKSKLVHALLLLLLALTVATTTVHVGCSGSSSADASGKEGARPAKNTEEGKKDDDGKAGEDGEDDEEEAVPVEVTALETGPIESILRFSSNLEAEQRVEVFSQAKRLVEELLVEEGDRVKRDQLLLRLQDDEQRSALAKVKSQLEKAEREYERQQRLYTQELISEQEYNDATYELEQLRISFADAERELGYTEVRAPIAGTVTARLVNLGDQVQIGQHLFDIVDFDSIVARVYVPEEHLRRLRPGLEARIFSQLASAREYRGEIERIAPVVDPKSGTVKVTVDVGAQEGLRPGMYVDVELVMATRSDALLVPKRALVYDNDQMYVYRLGGDNRVERVYIQPALSDKQFVEPREGLRPGDRVVVAGQAGLKDGALVSLPEQKAREGEGEATEIAADEEAETERAAL